jgi:hypothetical protein
LSVSARPIVAITPGWAMVDISAVSAAQPSVRVCWTIIGTSEFDREVWSLLRS